MKQCLPFIFSMLFAVYGASAQRFISDKSHISFYSEAPMEDIEAHTYQAKSIFDNATGEIVFSVPINTFQFEKSLMQEHFNEKYLESHKYSKGKFKGKVIGFKNDVTKQTVTAEGTLEIHGVAKEVSIEGEIESSSTGMIIRSSFPVRVADYKIKIPRLVASNIAEVVDVKLEFVYVPYNVQ
ncbi:MAG: YceI family protein [Cyclobacteriaceae bacterium]